MVAVGPRTSDRFVKARTTTAPVARSQAELERVLRPYGATGFGVTNDCTRQLVRVHFRLPDAAQASAPDIPIRLEIDVLR